MEVSISDLSPFAARGAAAQAAVDQAIQHAELVRLVRDRRAELGHIRSRHDGELVELPLWAPTTPGEARRRRDHLARLHQRHYAEYQAAQIRVALAETALEDFDRQAGRAPA